MMQVNKNEEKRDISTVAKGYRGSLEVIILKNYMLRNWKT